MNQILRPIGIWGLEHPVLFFSLLLLSLLAGAFLVLRPDKNVSQFQTREHERKTGHTHSAMSSKSSHPLLDAPIQENASDEEILKVSSKPSRSDILNAYRDRMKEYHPDRLQPKTDAEWARAHAIASRINQARDNLLKKVKP